MPSGWNLWVWLVSYVVRRYIYYRSVLGSLGSRPDGLGDV